MSNFKDPMRVILICKHCGRPEYYGDMRWLNGREECRSCYRHHREEIDREPYKYKDLDGPSPTMAEYYAQLNIRKED